MELGSFIKEHRETWSSLESLLDKFRRQKKNISAGDIDLLTVLYKQSSTHLAYLNTYFPGDNAAVRLNDLVTRAHNTLYRDRYGGIRQLALFFGVYLISLINRRRLFVVLAFLLFCTGALSGYLSVSANPLNLYLLLPPEISENIDPGRTGENVDMANSPVISSEIMVNNIKVAILAFVGGITFGLMTAGLLLYNGLLIGALAAVFHQSGKSYIFWAYILPHGIIELTAIFIAGGAGLYMGYRMLAPGKYARKYQLLKSAEESARLLLGTFPLFVVAGIIEGFITPSSLSPGLKYFFAAMTLALLCVWYLYGNIFSRQSRPLDLTSK
ncbi:MAG: stage II sporulation protein M [Bacillota bacterium]